MEELITINTNRILSRITNLQLAESALIVFPEISDLILNKFPELRPKLGV